MNPKSPLFIACLDPEESKALSELAQGIGYSDCHLAIGGMADVIKSLDMRANPPEYLIIDVGKSGKEVLPQIDDLADHCEPTVRVVVIGSINDITFYREIKSRGILEYFPRPVTAADIRPILLQTGAIGAGGGSQGSVITCMSAASGDGASTVAVNVAYCLAEVYNQPTVLVDMDYQFGLIAKSLDLTAPFGIRELFEHPDRGLDAMLVDKMLVKYGDKLNIIGSPNELRILPPIRPEMIRDLVAILRSKFRFVIIDVPHVWTDWTSAALAYSDHTLMVAQLWLRSLTHATRLLTAWQSSGIQRSRVSLIINRSGAKFKEAITAEDFESICHQKIEAHVPNDIKAVVQAETQGKTIFESGQGTQLQQQIKQMAQMVIQRCQNESGSSAGGAKKSLFGGLFKG